MVEIDFSGIAATSYGWTKAPGRTEEVSRSVLAFSNSVERGYPLDLRCLAYAAGGRPRRKIGPWVSCRTRPPQMKKSKQQ